SPDGCMSAYLPPSLFAAAVKASARTPTCSIRSPSVYDGHGVGLPSSSSPTRATMSASRWAAGPRSTMLMVKGLPGSRGIIGTAPPMSPRHRRPHLRRRPPAEPKGNDDHGRSDEHTDGVGGHQGHDPGRRPVGDPQQESDEQNREVAHGYLAGGLLAQHAADLQHRCNAHQYRPRRCGSGEDGYGHGAPWVRRPGYADRARQLP